MGIDRSSPYIHDEPENFVRALVDYTLMDDDELGLDDFIKHDGQDKST